MSTNQGTLKNEVSTNHSLGGPSTADNVTSLSTSDTTRLSKAFPNAPQFQESPTSTLFGPEVPLDREGYRAAYGAIVMNGENNLYSEHFGGDTVHMDYNLNSPPEIGNATNPVQPTDGVAAGANGSTIVAKGVGPNVGPSTVQTDLGPVAQAVVDATPTSYESVKSPHNTSVSIASGDIKSGGTPGYSPASIPST